MARRITVATVAAERWVEPEPEPAAGDREPRYAAAAVAAICRIHPSTLRRYERLGLVEPWRAPGEIPLYSVADIARLRRIQRLVDDLGVNLAGAEVILHMREQLLRLQDELRQLRQLLGDHAEPLA